MRWFLPLLMFLAAPAAAQEFTLPTQPVQVEADAVLPVIPAGWQSVRGPLAIFHGPADELHTLVRLSEEAERTIPQLASSLGVPLGEPIHIYLADSHTRFRDLQPGKAPLWADGVAYPTLDLIIMRENSLRGGQADPLEVVLRHELVHVLLGAAFAPSHPPSWLQEGLAQVWAGEVGPRTTETLAAGVASGSLISLKNLSRGFPNDPSRAQLAYAQSADLIGWWRDTYGEASIQRLIHELSTGASIEGAVHASTGELIETVEASWRGRLESSPFKWAALASFDLMAVGGLILVVGGIARRRRFHRRLEEMGAEEAALDALIASYQQKNRAYAR